MSTVATGETSPPTPPATSREVPWAYVLGVTGAAVVATIIRALNVLRWRPTCEEDMVAVIESGGTYDPSQCDPGTFAVWGDSAYGYLQARLLARGEFWVDGATWFVSGGEELQPSAGDPPLYPLFLAFFARFGLTSATSHRLLSAAAGVVGVILIAIIARKVAGTRAGVAAGFIAAVYPMLWINDGMLLSESLFVPLVALGVLATYRFWERPGYLTAALAGALWALAALVRAEGLFMAPVVAVVAIGLVGTSVRQRLAWVATAGVVGVAVLSPWLIYNNVRFVEPVFMTSQTGAVLSAASCDETFYGERLGYWDNCMEWYVATGRAEGWPDQSLDESQRDKVPRDAAVAYTRENLGRLPVVVAARVGRMWEVFRPGEGVDFNDVIEGRGRGPSEAGLVGYYLLVPAAIAGLVVAVRRRIPVSPLLAAPVAVTIAAAITFGITRYRAPGDAMVVVLAAVGIAAATELWRRSRWPGELRRRGEPVPGHGRPDDGGQLPGGEPPAGQPETSPSGSGSGTVGAGPGSGA